MIRILTDTDTAATTITVDGRLTSDYVGALETCVKQAFETEKPVHLFLRNISNIDESGRRLLGRLAGQGVQLGAAGVYSSYIVGEIGTSATQVEPQK